MNREALVTLGINAVLLAWAFAKDRRTERRRRELDEHQAFLVKFSKQQDALQLALGTGAANLNEALLELAATHPARAQAIRARVSSLLSN